MPLNIRDAVFRPFAEVKQQSTSQAVPAILAAQAARDAGYYNSSIVEETPWYKSPVVWLGGVAVAAGAYYAAYGAKGFRALKFW